MGHRLPRILALVAAWLLLMPMLAEAGEFVINPLRVTLDRSTRASEVVVRNEDRSPLRMQVEAMAWTQDDSGADQYAPAEGLLYFPRTMEIPPGESRIVRVGVRAAPVTREESYRLFIEELPPATAAEDMAQGASLRVFLRVGVAVFVAPAQPERKVQITRLALTGRLAAWTVENAGNVHLRAERVELTGRSREGATLFTQVFAERYFLAGATRTLRFELPHEWCAQLASMEATLLADRMDLKRRIDVEPGCR